MSGQREWAPGNVAMVVNFAGENKVARYTGRWGHAGEDHWSFADGSTLLPREVTIARPLVVIDPEDREQVERIAWLVVQQVSDKDMDLRVTSALQDALREFANPTPPKPDEPHGLGAVVEDASGRKWVRHEPDVASGTSRAWYPAGYVLDNKRTYWDEINAVRVLSEGVS